MKRNYKKVFLVATLFAAGLIAFTSTESKADGPFGRCGVLVVDTSDTNEDGFKQVACNYHFFKCECTR